MKVTSASIEKDLDLFTRISHKGIGMLVLKQGERCHMKITAQPEILDNIRFSVFANTLEITMHDAWELGLKSLFSLRTPDFVIEVTVTDLTELIQRGAGAIKNEGVLELPRLRVENRGLGEVTLNVHCHELTTLLAGMGNINLQGEADSHSAEIKGAGMLEANELQTKNTRVINSGVGSSNVYATETLYAELNGVGRITYRGNPRVQSKLNGLGSIVSV